jgi:hypothetical protein
MQRYVLVVVETSLATRLLAERARWERQVCGRALEDLISMAPEI